MAQIRQSRPDSGLDFQVNPFKSFPRRLEAERDCKLVRCGATVLATSCFAADCARRSWPVLSECGTHKAVMAIFWLWLFSPEFKLVRCGATVLATSRFAADCARRSLPVFERMWHIYANAAHIYSLCRVNMAQMRQSRPDSGLGLQVKVLKTF